MPQLPAFPFFVIGLIIVLAFLFFVADTFLDVIEKPKLKTKRLLSPAELTFYNYLVRATKGQYIIATHVPLSDVLKRQNRLARPLYTMFTKGHLDFVLVHPISGDPFLALELDDSTHMTPNAQNRDERKSKLLFAAKLPLYRFQVGQKWTESQITNILTELRNRNQASTAPPP